MGQKRNAISVRLGYNRNWKTVGDMEVGKGEKGLKEEIKIREYLEGVMKKRRIIYGDIYISRRIIWFKEEIIISIIVNKSDWEKIKKREERIIIKEIGKIIENKRREIKLEIIGEEMGEEEKYKRAGKKEVVKIIWNGAYIANYIAAGIERKMNLGKIERILDKEVRKNKGGYKLIIAGRMKGMLRAKNYVKVSGKVPIGKIEKNIDYGVTTAQIKPGKVGVKVWCYKEG